MVCDCQNAREPIIWLLAMESVENAVVVVIVPMNLLE